MSNEELLTLLDKAIGANSEDDICRSARDVDNMVFKLTKSKIGQRLDITLNTDSLDEKGMPSIHVITRYSNFGADS